MSFLKKNGFLLLMLCCANFLNAQAPIYLEISDCVKEFEYKHTETSGTNYEYYDYHFALNEYETAVFKIAKYSFEYVTAAELADYPLTKCDNNSLRQKLDENVIQNIQKGLQVVHLVKRTQSGYAIGKAINASYVIYLANDRYLRVMSQDVSFNYDGLHTYETGAELKTAGEGEFILYTTIKESCYEKPTFMHVPLNFMETSNIDYVLGVGMTRQYADEMENTLIAINGQPIDDYLATYCGQEVKVAVSEKTNKTTPINMNLVDTETAVLFENTETEAKGGDVLTLKAPEFEAKTVETETVIMEKEAAAVNILVDMTEPLVETIKKEEFHIVEEGETLYSISKKYNISTLKLKELNDLELNIIEIGQQLKIKKIE